MELKIFLEQRKHVMIEKPTAIRQNLVHTAKENHCFLMEAMKFPLFSAYQKPTVPNSQDNR